MVSKISHSNSKCYHKARNKEFFQLAMKLISKNRDLFPFNDNEIKTLYYHCAFLMMSYSFTDPEDEEEESDEINFEIETKKTEPIRFMLPVGDLLNHTWDNNARIEFDDGALTINAIKDIKKVRFFKIL